MEDITTIPDAQPSITGFETDRQRAEREYKDAGRKLDALLVARNELELAFDANKLEVDQAKATRTSKRKLLFALMSASEKQAARQANGDA